MCASPRSIAISARPPTSRRCWARSPRAVRATARRARPRPIPSASRQPTGSTEPSMVRPECIPANAMDRRFMQLALQLARRMLGRTAPNPAVGAVIADETTGEVITRSWTQQGGRPHAEGFALGRAGARARGATMYVTLEPCSHHGRTPPCANAIAAAGIRRVVCAVQDPNPEIAGRGFAVLRDAGIVVEVGVGAAEAARAHAGHIRRVRDGRPHVLLKLAVSADAKAGLVGRRPIPITGEPARARVHALRAMSDAVLTGIGTVLADDPLLTCRLSGM